jgi:tetratricopeptide (TPR) repeat protein
MGDPEAEYCLAAVRGLTRERGIALLDRAAEIGLLYAHGDGYYGIHPALPWYFRGLFSRDFPEDGGDASRAFVAAMGSLSSAYHDAYQDGHREILSVVMAEEDNLLAAWRIARAHGWWDGVLGAMQGLRTLYAATGRGTAWRRLVNDTVPDFIDPATDGPLPGREEHWSLVTEYRVGLAREDGDLVEAESLQRIRVDRARRRAQLALAIAPDRRDAKQRNAIRTLAASMHSLGQIQREQNSPTCAATYREALDLANTLDDAAMQAACAFNLGLVYDQIQDLRNLDEAEHWFRKSLDLQAPDDKLGRGRCVGSLGMVAYERFLDARTAKRPVEELARHLAEAARLYEQTLDMIPATAVTDLRTTHTMLGNVYDEAGDIDRALHNYRQSIQYADKAGDIFAAGQARFNVALTLFKTDRLTDARAYAEAALANFRTFGDRAEDKIQKTERLIAAIDQAIAKKASGA